MFTGIVETVGRIATCEAREGSTRLVIESDLPQERMALGDSIAVDGVCLTVAGWRDRRFDVDVVAETLERTTLGGAAAGRQVNLERSLRVGDPLGGHLVQGHVDGTVEVAEVRGEGDDRRVAFTLVPEVRGFVAWKGSVALDGVSLTVAELTEDRFGVALIPQTLERTTLGRLARGDRVNVEVDLLARYLESLMRERGPAPPR